MNLIEALEMVKKPASENSPSLRIFFACGFTPLHLQTFLAAHLRNLRSTHRADVTTGVFGDLAGNLERLDGERYDAVAVAIEWSDLDPRLGVRTLGGWQLEKLPDILECSARSFERLAQALRRIALPTTVSLPTLPLPPLFYSGTMRSSAEELILKRQAASFAEAISRERRIAVICQQELDERSPLAGRFDLRTEILQGFPYKTAHASVIGELMAELVVRSQPKKGLITDLDDTLWAGILGEQGVDGVQWHLEEHAQLHGLYQQFLASLASAGTLIGVASKNDPELAAAAFERHDLLLPKGSVYPIEANWNRKSESVQRILKKWNILPDSVVFVDDSPMELAEVQSAFPEMECVLFPKGDYVSFWAMLRRLRDQFGKPFVTEEDSLRLQSIRNSAGLEGSPEAEQVSMSDFLRAAEGQLTFVHGIAAEDTRAFELVNKTNQFNLNGIRYDEAAWSKRIRDPRTRVITVSYKDKFGKLGRIAVMLGRLEGKTMILESWVMSCRAFSRRIEFHCLEYLYERLGVEEIVFQAVKTDRNRPLVEFLEGLTDATVQPSLHMSRAAFVSRAPERPHHSTEESYAIGQ
ncbi:MAG TPA: HAD-IIIC family phosphatase [Terracidiphilus sp.]|jgi:FkbH-like protein